MSSEQTTVAQPGPEAGRDRDARDVRSGWWVHLADTNGAARWRLVADVQFPRAAASGMKRLIVCADGVEAERGAREQVRALNLIALRKLGLEKVDPGTLA
ncbi:hypothetical protein ACIBTV_26645 [Micromonospora sp. NPDC049366]|uniref:hypothetical protein n=1 Tax=Micromonospora sp. NPDC049366 TaxID=3364271 RepID=UPI003788F608